MGSSIKCSHAFKQPFTLCKLHSGTSLELKEDITLTICNKPFVKGPISLSPNIYTHIYNVKCQVPKTANSNENINNNKNKTRKKRRRKKEFLKEEKKEEQTCEKIQHGFAQWQTDDGSASKT